MMRVYDLKAGHSRWVVAGNSPVTKNDPLGLRELISPTAEEVSKVYRGVRKLGAAAGMAAADGPLPAGDVPATGVAISGAKDISDGVSQYLTRALSRSIPTGAPCDTREKNRRGRKPKQYFILDGVRRGVATRESGKGTIQATIHNDGLLRSQTLRLDQLWSPKTYIETDSRYVNALREVILGTSPPIDVEPLGSPNQPSSIPLNLVEIDPDVINP